MSVGHIDPTRLDPGAKAALLYAQARSELSGRLWQAALGDDGPDEETVQQHDGLDLNFDTLVALLGDGAARTLVPLVAAPIVPSPTARPRGNSDDLGASYDRPDRGADGTDGGGRRGAPGMLGANAAYIPPLSAAAARTGIPAPALAAIIQAEASKGADGRWLAYSRNPRSSAAGLGQFLSATWVGEAERAGTWLHDIAVGRGWLDDRGRVESTARSALLALRYDATTAIEATADYAKANISQLRSAGVDIGHSVESVARSAYVGHHLGLGDAIRFLTTGLDPSRARTLLRAQIGAASADERIAEAGSATRAHRDWLMGFVERHVRPTRFAASFIGADHKI